MVRGKAIKKKEKNMKTIFVIVIVVLVLAFVLFMQYQKPVVEDEEGLAQMFSRSIKPSSDFKLIPGIPSFDCPANEVKYCEDKFECDAFAYACMFYCKAEGWNCCMMDIWEDKEGDRDMESKGHVVIIGEVESDKPGKKKFCIFESQIDYSQPLHEDDEPCCWYQDESEGSTPSESGAKKCMEEYPFIGDIVCSTDPKDFERITPDVDSVFPFPKEQCEQLNNAFEGAGYPNVCFYPR